MMIERTDWIFGEDVFIKKFRIDIPSDSGHHRVGWHETSSRYAMK
jgi:hypothetical protein